MFLCLYTVCRCGNPRDIDDELPVFDPLSPTVTTTSNEIHNNEKLPESPELPDISAMLYDMYEDDPASLEAVMSFDDNEDLPDVPVCAGVLERRLKLEPFWATRYCTLNGHCLKMYENEKDVTPTTWCAEINILNCKVKKLKEDVFNKKFCYELAVPTGMVDPTKAWKRHVFVARSQEDRSEWVKGLKKCGKPPRAADSKTSDSKESKSPKTKSNLKKEQQSKQKKNNDFEANVDFAMTGIAAAVITALPFL